MKNLKYNYYAVIQQNYGYGWEDVSEYETNSQFKCLERHTDGKSLLHHDIKEYRLTGYATRIINRKTQKQ